MLKIGHEVVRPGKRYGDSPVTIPVPDELETVPGIPTNSREVDWYAREHPLVGQNYSESAAQDWQFGTLKQEDNPLGARQGGPPPGARGTGVCRFGADCGAHR